MLRHTSNGDCIVLIGTV